VLDRIFLLNLYRIQLRNMDIIKTYSLYIDRGEIARSETHTTVHTYIYDHSKSCMNQVYRNMYEVYQPSHVLRQRQLISYAPATALHKPF
jgi:hypothetical protein